MVGAQADSRCLRCSLGLAAETAQQVKPRLLLPEQIMQQMSELSGHFRIISWHLYLACDNEHCMAWRSAPYCGLHPLCPCDCLASPLCSEFHEAAVGK